MKAITENKKINTASMLLGIAPCILMILRNVLSVVLTLYYVKVYGYGVFLTEKMMSGYVQRVYTLCAVLIFGIVVLIVAAVIILIRKKVGILIAVPFVILIIEKILNIVVPVIIGIKYYINYSLDVFDIISLVIYFILSALLIISALTDGVALKIVSCIFLVTATLYHITLSVIGLIAGKFSYQKTMSIFIALVLLLTMAQLVISVLASVKAKKAQAPKYYIPSAPQNTVSYSAVKTLNTQKPESEVISGIKGYKELLDSGAITQEEYEKKKKELLNN